MVNTEPIGILKCDEITHALSHVQPRKNSLFKFIFHVLHIGAAIAILLFGLLGFLFVATQLNKILRILNQLIYHTMFVGTTGRINLLSYFSSQLLTTISSVLLIVSGFHLLLNKYRWRIVFIAGVCVLVVQLGLDVISKLLSEQEDTRAKEKLSEGMKNVDRATVTDPSIIWHLQDPQLCKNIKNYNIRKNCITGFDPSIFTIEFCLDLSKEYDKNLCLADVAEQQKNKDICYTIPDEFRKNFCLAMVAKVLKDEQLCYEVTDISGLHNTCIVNVGIELRDPSYCERAADQIGKDNCYDSIAMFTQNRLLCERIASLQYREACIHTVETRIK